MLFNSYGFILLFLPIVLIGFFQLGRINHTYAAAWLALVSLFFYGYWNVAYVGLLLGSVAVNYILGLWIAKAGVRHDEERKKQLLIVAITTNLLLLAYYKYANFFIGNANNVAGTQWNVGDIILPLGISFFTFTQIAYLVDTYQGKVKEYNFIHYILFVTYFPHLIAGPVLHHKEMMPQFAKLTTYRFSYENLSMGLTIFTIGLAKKVLLADSLAEYATPAFDAAHNGVQLQFFAAWVGALAYTFQLYFDFSGYSDMAIGISKMFGVDLPINFNSPYKAHNIIEFWRRWHMTLSRFLRDYLYIPLGGNRKGAAHRYLNLMITMLLGGLWHGANWTFVIWGGLHGLYLVFNHLWLQLQGVSEPHAIKSEKRLIGTLTTFIAVVCAWVFFRAETISTAFAMIKGMMGLNGISLPYSLAIFGKYIDILPFDIKYGGIFAGTNTPPQIIGLLFWFTISFYIIWVAPNSQQLLANKSVSLSDQWKARSGAFWGALFALSILSFSHISEFLYFQF